MRETASASPTGIFEFYILLELCLTAWHTYDISRETDQRN